MNRRAKKVTDVVFSWNLHNKLQLHWRHEEKMLVSPLKFKLTYVERNEVNRCGDNTGIKKSIILY